MLLPSITISPVTSQTEVLLKRELKNSQWQHSFQSDPKDLKPEILNILNETIKGVMKWNGHQETGRIRCVLDLMTYLECE